MEYIVMAVIICVSFCAFCTYRAEKNRLDTEQFLTRRIQNRTEIHNHFYGQITDEQMLKIVEMQANSNPLSQTKILNESHVPRDVLELTDNVENEDTQEQNEWHKKRNGNEDTLQSNSETKELKSELIVPFVVDDLINETKLEIPKNNVVEIDGDKNLESLYASLTEEENISVNNNTPETNKANSTHDISSFWNVPIESIDTFMQISELAQLVESTDSLYSKTEKGDEIIFPVVGKITAHYQNKGKYAIRLSDPYKNKWIEVNEKTYKFPKETVVAMFIKVQVQGEKILLSRENTRDIYVIEGDNSQNQRITDSHAV